MFQPGRGIEEVKSEEALKGLGGEPEEPYLDKRYNPPRWVGTPKPRRNPDNPKCPKCGRNDRVEILCYAFMDSDGYFNPEGYRCFRCGCDF
jgi:hypothetical protein